MTDYPTLLFIVKMYIKVTEKYDITYYCILNVASCRVHNRRNVYFNFTIVYRKCITCDVG